MNLPDNTAQNIFWTVWSGMKQKRIVYHRISIVGDYDDFESVEQLMEFLEVTYRNRGTLTACFGWCPPQ